MEEGGIRSTARKRADGLRWIVEGASRRRARKRVQGIMWDR